jgi:hypothetical protein
MMSEAKTALRLGAQKSLTTRILEQSVDFITFALLICLCPNRLDISEMNRKFLLTKNLPLA